MHGSRRRQEPRPRPRGRRLIATAVAIIAAAAGAATLAGTRGAEVTRAAGGGSGLLRLHAVLGRHEVIRDSAGRQILLRGINVSGLSDLYQVNPSLPTTVPLRSSDYAQLSRLGFNVVRLVVSWSKLEPNRGEFNENYVDRIRQAVDWGGEHGIYTVIDMHQDGWGKYVATPPGTQCPDGWHARQGWDGAPEWATILDGETTCRPREVLNKRTPAELQAFKNFWLDTDGIQTELVHTWRQLAAAFADDPAVAGFDLMNEPDPGNAGPPGQTNLLGRFYRHSITAIRHGEADGGGFRHMILFEPSLLWWRGAPAKHSAPPGFTDDRDVVFAPHVYGGAIAAHPHGLRWTLRRTKDELRNGARRGRRYGTPVWIGEWGWFGNPRENKPKIAEFARLQDARIWGGVWWQWKKGCGDPTNFSGPDDQTPASPSGNLAPYKCPEGTRLPTPPSIKRILERSYPRAAPGRITRLHSDWSSGDFQFTGVDGSRQGSCKLELWVPSRDHRRPSVHGTGLRRIHRERVGGGWSVTACASGHYTITGGYR